MKLHSGEEALQDLVDEMTSLLPATNRVGEALSKKLLEIDPNGTDAMVLAQTACLILLGAAAKVAEMQHQMRLSSGMTSRGPCAECTAILLLQHVSASTPMQRIEGLTSVTKLHEHHGNN